MCSKLQKYKQHYALVIVVLLSLANSVRDVCIS